MASEVDIFGQIRVPAWKRPSSATVGQRERFLPSAPPPPCFLAPRASGSEDNRSRAVVGAALVRARRLHAAPPSPPRGAAV